MPETIGDESSLPEELDDGVQQMCIDSSSEPGQDVLCDLGPEAGDTDDGDDEVQLVCIKCRCPKRCCDVLETSSSANHCDVRALAVPFSRIGQQRNDTMALKENITSLVLRRRFPMEDAER